MVKKIRCNDEVIVITGKNKGKIGRVKFIFSDKNRAIVSGVNIIKKHQKPIPHKNKSGGIVHQESSIDLSNVAIFNPILSKPDKVRFKIKDGKKIRIFKSDGSLIK